MRLVPGGNDKYRLISTILIALIIGTTVACAILFANQAAQAVDSELRRRSQTIAAALNSDEVMRLKGTTDDELSDTYKDLKTRLADVKHANPSARSIYLMGRHDEQLFFYVDSEQPDSEQYSPAGEFYDDATPELAAMFNNGQPLVEGPVRDSFGTFISGLAPLFKPGTQEVIAVVGVDMLADSYWQVIGFSALLPTLVGAGFLLVVIVFEWIRRRNQQLLNIRSELVSVASHELRNPITGIRWAAESLKKMSTDERLAPLVNAIYDSASRLQTSTDDILTLTHAVKQQKLVLAPTDLIAVMQEVLAIQQLAAKQKNVIVVCDSSWPAKLVVNCDADKIKRAFHNVISNAIKYTRDDTIVTLAYHADAKSHNLLITDQGIGIPKDEHAKVFAGFYRASNAVASEIPGTGLGLYLVKVVFEQHDGHVSFVSDRDKGATFTLSLPK